MVEVNDQATANIIKSGVSRDGKKIDPAYNKLIWKEMSPLGKLQELSHQAGKFFNKNNYENYSSAYYVAMASLSAKATDFATPKPDNTVSPRDSSVDMNAGKAIPEQSVSNEKAISMRKVFRNPFKVFMPPYNKNSKGDQSQQH